MNIKKQKKGVTDSLKRLSHVFTNTMYPIIGEEVTATVLEARGSHRFVTRTGFAERSIKSDIKKIGNKINARVYLDDTVSNYSKFLHNGFKSWKKDPFLKEAFDKHDKILEAKLNSALKRKM